MNKISSQFHNYRLVSAGMAGVAVVVGVLVLVGWWLHIPVLTSVVPGLVTMKPNTAACFLLAGIALWLQRSPEIASRFHGAKKVAVRVCASAIGVMGALTFGERVLGWNLGIDELLCRQTLLATQVPRPGLMAAATALAFFLLGTALLSLDWETQQKRRPAQGMALVVLLVGFVAVLGYLYGVQLLFGVAGYAAVDVNTGVVFMLLGTGVLFARPDHGLMAVLTSQRLGGLMARRLLPFLVMLPIVIGWLRIQGQRAGFYQSEIGSALFTGAYVIILASVVWLCALWLNRADAARRRAEERDQEIAALVESSSDAIIGKTLEGTITSWNKGAERVYGFREEEVLGKNIALLVPTALADDIPRLLDAIRKDTPTEGFETVRRRKDGTFIHVSLTISPIHDRDGRITGASTVARDITDRKRTEERLSQSQAQLGSIIDSAMDALITVDSTQQVVMFNPAAEKMFGCSAADALGSPLERFLPERFRAAHSSHIQRFGETGVTSRAMGVLGALKGLRANGVEFPIEASISQTNASGKKLFTAIVRDVTERERSERALREQASVLELAQVLVRDMDDRIVLWNRGAEKLYGFTREEALGRTSQELLQTEFPEPPAAIFERLMSAGEWEGELVHRKRDGSRIVVASVWSLERDVNGRPSRILESNTDITGRKRAEEAVKLAQARLLSALEGGGMGTWVWDIGNPRVDWDDSMSALFGRSVEELADGSIEPFFSWVHPDDRERLRTALESAVREGKNYEAEYRLFRPDQSMVWIAARGRVECDAQGKVFRMTGVCIDITDRKKMEEQLLQSQKMQALGTLAGGIAHDFNNILMAIGGNASLAMEELPPDHPTQTSLREVSKAAARATNLVRQILAFSRRQAPDRKSIAVKPVVEEALALLRATMPARIEIRSQFPDGLPSIFADSTQLHQVIMNLGTNAARAIGEHGGLLEVTARDFVGVPDYGVGDERLKEGDYVRLSVRDSGCGMNAATMERIFDPFFTTQPPGQGTGLGLSVVHGIMKDHHGSVTVYSELGAGSIFHLYFPAIREAVTKGKALHAAPRGGGQRLLYVDDEEALVMLATRALGRLGYKVTGETDPVRALRLFRENPAQFDAVVTDLSMPGMSGAELARQILESRRDIPVVMMSGYIRPEDEQEARRLGIGDLILKPDSIEDLTRALNRLLVPDAADSGSAIDSAAAGKPLAT